MIGLIPLVPDPTLPQLRVVLLSRLNSKPTAPKIQRHKTQTLLGKNIVSFDTANWVFSGRAAVQ